MMFRIAFGSVFVLLVVCFFMGCDTVVARLFHKRDEVTKGKGYGFVIGASKEDCYDRIHLDMNKHLEMRLVPWASESTEQNSLYSDISRVRHPSEVTPQDIEIWDEWRIESTSEGSRESVKLRFQGKVLESITIRHGGDGSKIIGHWSTQNQAIIDLGQTRAEVSREIARMPEGYEVTAVPNRRRFPVRADKEEYRFIASEDVWIILVDGNWDNSIKLEFDQGRLRKISRRIGDFP